MTHPVDDNPLSGKWLVDADYEIMSVPEFDNKYSHYLVGGVRVTSPGLADALRAGRALFDTKAQAAEHAIKLLDMSLAESEARTASLRARRLELTEHVTAA